MPRLTCLSWQRFPVGWMKGASGSSASSIEEIGSSSSYSISTNFLASARTLSFSATTRQSASPSYLVISPSSIKTSQSWKIWPTLLFGTSLAVRTPITPGRASALVVSILRTLALGNLLLIADPTFISSKIMSSTYSPMPRTLSWASILINSSPTLTLSFSSVVISILPFMISEASLIPSMIFTYPVHLQIFCLMPAFISSLLGFGFFLIIAAPLITIPGIQKPHWTAPALEKAWTKAFFSSSVRPSMVRISSSLSLESFWVQESFLLSPTRTVQVPQAPWEQPSFTEVICKSSRKNLRRVLSS